MNPKEIKVYPKNLKIELFPEAIDDIREAMTYGIRELERQKRPFMASEARKTLNYILGEYEKTQKEV